jgi:hypothetical protein
MKWTEISKWAKSLDYKVSREKIEPKVYKYTWSKDTSGGEEDHVRDLAVTIFNHHTNNRWVDHQNNYVAPIKEFKI